MYGKKLKTVRIKNGLTQMEVGAKIGKSKQWVSEFERGNIRLNLDVAIQLATALGVSADIFLPKKSKKIGQVESEAQCEPMAPNFRKEDDHCD